MRSATCSRTLVMCALAVAAGTATRIAPAAAQSFTEYDVPTVDSRPCGITVGPDGNLWFTEALGNKVGTVTITGTFAEFPIPTVGSNSCHITTGPDGNVWFTEGSASKVGRVTTSGHFTEYDLPSGGYPQGIAAGPDGNLWFTVFTDSGLAKICTVTPAGIFTEYTIPTFNSVPVGITLGPDGNLWFAEQSGNKIGTVTPIGIFNEYGTDGTPSLITGGSDGNLWFSKLYGNAIGMITPTGTVIEYSVPTPNSLPFGITLGPDGNIWFVEAGGNNVGTVTSAGTVNEYSIPTASSGPQVITTGPDGNLWFTEWFGNKIGRLNPSGGEPTPPTCRLTPDVGCRKPTRPLKSMVVLKDRLPDTHDLLTWKWTKGEATLKADFGNPLATTNYALCVYDDIIGMPTLKVAADIPAGGTCGEKLCWKETGHGFKYVNKGATPDGVVLLTLKEGLQGLAQITLKAMGIDLQMPSLPLDQDPTVTVQLKNDRGICWDADYTAPAITNTQIEFRDKSD